MTDPETKADTTSQEARRAARLPRGVWILGFGSLLMDTSSELVNGLLPVFMTTVLGASMLTVGWIEGIAEATASITKVFSGALSDSLRRRKLLIVSGYGLSALTKPIFPLATSLGWVVGARFADRVGKGIRGAPRDALIADIVPEQQRGAAYGLRQALDTVGAFLGPLLAVICMAWLVNDVRRVLWVAAVPAVLAVVVLAVALQEPERAERSAGKESYPSLSRASRLSSRYWMVVALGAVFTLARFSEAFLILRAQDVGLAIGYVPLILIVMSAVYAACAYPAGAAADRYAPRTLLVAGLAVLIVADLLLATASAASIAFAGAAFWGLHMALTQGLFSKLVADAAPPELRGTAFGVFNLVTGLALLAASVIAGWLWSTFGASSTFVAGAMFALLAALGLLVYHPHHARAE